MSTIAAAPGRGAFLRRAAGLVAAAAASLLASCASTNATEPAVETPQIGLYEMRVYTAAEGKMDALNARFRDHTVALFRKHGMTPLGFFTVATAEGQPADDRLIYFMGYEDRAARDAAWRAFAGDPDWQEVYRTSQADGSLTSKIESVFLTGAEYMPQMATASSATPRHFELRTYKAAPGKLENVHARFRDHTRGIFEKHNMSNIGYWRPVAGQEDMDEKMVYLLAFPNAAARGPSWRAFATDPQWQQVAQESEKDGRILAETGAIVSVQLTPTDYSPLK